MLPGQLQACLADLTEAVHLAEGRTRLFIPTDALETLTASLQDKVSPLPPDKNTNFRLPNRLMFSRMDSKTCPLVC